MRWQIGWQGIVLAVLLFGGGMFVGSYRFRGEPTHSSVTSGCSPHRRGRRHRQRAQSCTYRCIRVCTSA
jgi:hypothetical protein